MAIAYPRAFPAGIYLATTEFDYSEIVGASPLGNGSTIGAPLWPARWRGAWRTQWLAGPQLGAVQAWLASLRNGGKPFYGRTTRQAALTGYPAGLGVSPGLASLLSTTRIALAGMPAGAVLKPGDQFSIAETVSGKLWRALCRIEEAASADGSGDIGELAFGPALPAGVFSGSAAVDFASPSAIMKLKPDSVAEERWAGRMRYSFSGEQSWSADP